MRELKVGLRYLLVGFLVFSFFSSIWLVEFVKAGEGWEPMLFEPGQSFTYFLRGEEDGIETLGEVTLSVFSLGDDFIELIFKGEFGGEEFEIFVDGDRFDTEQIYIDLMVGMMWEVPEMVFQILMFTFLQPWMETPLNNAVLSPDWRYEGEDDYGDFFFIEVVEQRNYAGFDGFLIRADVEVDFDYLFEICISPDLPLPIMGRVFDFMEGDQFEGGSLYAELINFEQVSLSEVVPVERRTIEPTILDDLVDYFVENGLDVGERQMKAYRMLGASAGFGLIVEEDEVELYLFDPETATEKTLEYLYAARETGKFVFEEMGGMEIPVVINGYIMLTGLEFGTFYQHPAKDLIVEVFNSF